MNIAEQFRGSTDGNDVYHQQNFFIAGNTPKNNRRASYAVYQDRSAGATQEYPRCTPTMKAKQSPAYRDTQQSKGLRKPSFNEPAWDHSYMRHCGQQEDSSRNHMKSDYRDEVISTSSSVEQSKSAHEQSAIEHFKVVVLGDVNDGIKYKNLHQSKFAAAVLYQAPEATDLVIPDF